MEIDGKGGILTRKIGRVSSEEGMCLVQAASELQGETTTTNALLLAARLSIFQKKQNTIILAKYRVVRSILHRHQSILEIQEAYHEIS